MGEKSHQLSLILAFAGLILLFHGCKNEINKTDYLRKVLNNLEQIKSATYNSVMTFNPPGDTSRFVSYSWYKKEYINPADTSIGSSFSWFYPDDTSKMYLYYDGLASANLDINKKIISIDSFKTNTLSFRPVSSPFFANAKNIIRYALETKDSITTDIEEYGDSIRFKLYIPHKVKYFFGKPVEMDNPYLSKEEAFTRFDIWIEKSNYLPYRITNKMPQAISIEDCKNAILNKSRIEDFRPVKYFPKDYEVAVRGQKPVLKNMIGKIAPDWILIDYNNTSVALKDLKSKVLMIEFTGIGCAPCHSAIPFLKQLASDYKDNDFELVSIETWGSDIEGLRRYHENNKLNYSLLMASDKITENYDATSVPSFFILDKERVIKKIIWGYEKETTDKEIRDAINDLY